jgi:hypothetical protein
MDNINQQELAMKIGNWVSVRINKYEIMLSFVFFTGLLLHLLIDADVRIMMILPLSLLSVLYFFNAFAVPDEHYPGALMLFFHKLACFATSVTLIGIIFRIQHFPGYEMSITIGTITLLVLLPFMFFVLLKKEEGLLFYQRLLLRIGIVAASGLLFYFT